MRMLNLSLRQKIILKIAGSVFIGYEKREGWSEANKIYVVKCSKHGLYSGMCHGYHDALPQCPKCIKEAVEITKKANKNEMDSESK